MRRLLLVLLVACSSPPPSKPAAPSNTPAPVPVDQHASAFFGKLADVMDGAGGDCDKLGVGLEALAPDAKGLRAELVADHEKLDDVKLDDATMKRLGALKTPDLLDKCENNPAVHKAVDDTLLTLAPIGENDGLAKAFGDALGKAAATK